MGRGHRPAVLFTALALCAHFALGFRVPNGVPNGVPNSLPNTNLGRAAAIRGRAREQYHAASFSQLRMRNNELETGVVNNKANAIVLERLLGNSRRAILQATAVGAASLLFADKGVLSPLRPLRVDAAPLADQLYDLGLSSYHKAPGVTQVVAEGGIEKSPADTRSYRALTLANGLRVLLASDPRLDQAAAALDVHVGHFSDPANFPGLAHFCEHMLFLGNKKYPNEGDLDAFLGQHGGSSNAYTAGEDTCYYFNVNQDALKPALERFSQFFVSPLFTATATDRELNAIEAENSKNLQQDSWRLDQLAKEQGNPMHPYSKFGTGNRNTLKDAPKLKGLEVGAELLRYYNRYYSANLMTLAVVGKDNLDSLELWVKDMFEAVPNHDVPPPEIDWAGKIAPFKKDSSSSIVSVVPIEDDRSMELKWVLPFTSAKDKQNRMETKPDFLVAALLGHEGKGSLLSYLKERALATSVGASLVDQTSDFQVIAVGVELTLLGLEKQDDVIQAIFAYIKMVQDSAPLPPYLIQEAQNMSEVSWLFREQAEPGGIVSAFAANMQDFPPEQYLRGPVKISGMQSKDVSGIFEKLTAQDVLITLVSKTFEATAKKKEKWYQTLYSSTPVTSERRKLWASPPIISALHLPAPNPFIPGDVSLREKAVEDLNRYPEGPSLVCETPKFRLHYKGDRRYGQPKAYAFFNIKLPQATFGTSITPRTAAIERLYKASLGDALNEYVYDAAVAGLGVSLELTPKAARLSFSGYSDKLTAFVDTMARTIAAHRPDDPQKLARFKDQISRDLKAFDTQQPYQHAAFYNAFYTSFPAFLPSDVLRELETVTVRDVELFSESVWSSGFGEVLVQGNVLEEEARAMVKSVELALNFTELKISDQARTDVYEIPLSPKSMGSVIRTKEPNVADANSAAMVQFQHRDQDLSQQMALEALASIIEQPFYKELRTKQQLGYIVSSGVKVQRDVRSLVFTVQSSVADAVYLTDKIFAFVDAFATELDAQSEEEINGYIAALVEQKMQKITRLSDETLRNWAEIVEGKYEYDRALIEAKATKELNKKFLLKVWSQVVVEGGSQRRVLTSQVFTQADTKSLSKVTAPLPLGATLLTDAPAFRRSATGIVAQKGNAPPIPPQQFGGWV